MGCVEIQLLPTTLEPERALRRSRGANPATLPSSSLMLRLRQRGMLFELGKVGGELDGRYFGVGIICVEIVPALDASTSENSEAVAIVFSKTNVKGCKS